MNTVFIDVENGFIQVTKDIFNKVYVYYVDSNGDLKLKSIFDFKSEEEIRKKVNDFKEQVGII